MASEAPTNAASPAAAQASAPSPAVPAPAVSKPGASPAPMADGAAPTPEAAPAPKKEEVDFSARFAALTKKERSILEKERQIKAAEKARESDPDYVQFQEFKKARENAKVNPLAYLEAAGLSYGQVSEFLLNDKKLTPEQRVEMLEESIRKDKETQATKAREDQEAADKAKKAAEDAEVEEVLQGHKQSVAKHLEEGGDVYELTLAHGEDGVELVNQVIMDYFEANQTILPIADAAKYVEEHLEKVAREKVLSLKRFQPKQGASADASAAGGQTTTPPPATQTTLTNRAVASAPPVESHRDLSDEESKRRAAALLRWT